jgi:hypothetical protein
VSLSSEESHRSSSESGKSAKSFADEYSMQEDLNASCLVYGVLG